MWLNLEFRSDWEYYRYWWYKFVDVLYRLEDVLYRPTNLEAVRAVTKLHRELTKLSRILPLPFSPIGWAARIDLHNIEAWKEFKRVGAPAKSLEVEGWKKFAMYLLTAGVS